MGMFQIKAKVTNSRDPRMFFEDTLSASAWRLIAAIWVAMAAIAGAGADVALAQAPVQNGAAAIEQAVVEAIARAEKSVVAIARVRKERPGEQVHLEPRPDAFGSRRLIPVPAPQPTDPDFAPNDFASGVVVDRQGLILTAYHVLEEESDYYIATPDRKVLRARVVAADPRSDLAVLAPDAGRTPGMSPGPWAPIVLGDAAGLKKGQFVVALGNPYAIARDGQASASWGIVANLARKAPPVPDDVDLTGKGTIHHFGTLIQTDAKLNVGSSGSPLVNLKGEMVGLVTAIPAVVGYQEAAGYAIPADAMFRRALEALKQGREVEYGFLGIQLGVARNGPVLESQGTRVERVMPGLPAARHGLRPGDVILAVNDTQIRDPDELVREISKLPLDAVVKLGLARGERKLQLDVPLTKYRVRGKKIVTALPPAWRGMRIDYASAVLDSFAVSPPGGSPLGEAIAVTDVQRGTPAWDAGLRPGMLMSHVERAPVRTPKEFRDAVSKKAGPIEVRVVGEGTEPGVKTIRPES
jgi:serine protease Do